MVGSTFFKDTELNNFQSVRDVAEIKPQGQGNWLTQSTSIGGLEFGS